MLAGFRLPPPTLPTPILQAAANNLLHHLYGPQGPSWGTPFADLEELVVQLSDTLGSELLHQALQRQPEHPTPDPLRHSPSWGRTPRPADPESRSVRAPRHRRLARTRLPVRALSQGVFWFSAI